MRILAFDTSQSIGSVAAADGERVLYEERSAVEARHGDTLLPSIKRALDAAGWAPQALDLVAVGVGPGSFTGLRVGLATAKGLALALPLRLRGVCSLRALARGVCERAELALALLDAGKGELFGAAFRLEGGALVSVLPPARGSVEELLARVAVLPAHSIVVCGGGARREWPALVAALGPRARLTEPERDFPDGRHVALEGRLGFAAEGPSDAAALTPSYLRDSDAQLPREPLALG